MKPDAGFDAHSRRHGRKMTHRGRWLSAAILFASAIASVTAVTGASFHFYRGPPGVRRQAGPRRQAAEKSRCYAPITRRPTAWSNRAAEADRVLRVMYWLAAAVRERA